MDLNELTVFVKVVQTGSFTRAAKALGMPNSTVSARVASLEERLGVTLLRRTTRTLHITPAGELFSKQCTRALQDLQNAELELTSTQSEPVGLLRATAPQGFATWTIPTLSCQFSQKYPNVELEWIFTDQNVDLFAEGIDVAIRAGKLVDSSLMARKVGLTYFATFASPEYLANAPPLKHPNDLQQHRCLRFTSRNTPIWNLANGDETFSMAVRGAVLANNIGLIQSLAVDGQGIAFLPMFQCQANVNAGRLVRVLPGWASGASPVHLVYPAQKFQPPKLQAFLQLAEGLLKSALAI